MLQTQPMNSSGFQKPVSKDLHSYTLKSIDTKHFAKKLHHQAAFCIFVLQLTFAQMCVITEHGDNFYAFQFMSFQDMIFEASVCMGHSNPSTIQHSTYPTWGIFTFISLSKSSNMQRLDFITVQTRASKYSLLYYSWSR